MAHREVLQYVGCHHLQPYLQEQVAECRELNSTEQWLAVAAAVNPLAQSMPLLLHHQVSLLARPLEVLQLSCAWVAERAVREDHGIDISEYC